MTIAAERLPQPRPRARAGEAAGAAAREPGPAPPGRTARRARRCAPRRRPGASPSSASTSAVTAAASSIATAAAGNRVGAQLPLAAPACDATSRAVNGGAASRASACGARPAQPELGREARAWGRRVQRGHQGGPVGDHEVGRLQRGRPRESPGDPGNAKDQALAGDVDPEQAVAPGELGHARRDDGRDAQTVGGLPRAQVGVDLVGERQPEPHAVSANQARRPRSCRSSRRSRSPSPGRSV